MKLTTTLLAAAAALVIGAPLTALAEDTLTIAMAGPLTGGEASFGDQMKRGAEMAVADLNAAGGLLGKKLVLLVGDDACDPKQAVAVANKLVQDGAKVVIGHFCSSTSIPASKVYAEENVIQITPASTNPTFTENGLGNVFRICGRDDQQGKIAGQYLAKEFRGKKIVIINDKTAYGKGLADETRKVLNAAGVTEVLFETYTKGEKDFTALVTKMKQVGVDVVYVGGYYAEGGLIARQLRDQGIKAQIISGDAFVTNEYWAVTGSAGEGTMMTFGPDPRRQASAASAVAKFRAAGIEPEGYTLYSYAAVQVFAQAVTKVGGTDTAKVQKQLHSGTFQTVLGDLNFDVKGDVMSPAYVWYKWHDGKYGQVE
ncbi:L-leucine/L-phenylalanine ABC transporter periplasmic binding protein [uncultured Gammaproteobacteria bacterium]